VFRKREHYKEFPKTPQGTLAETIAPLPNNVSANRTKTRITNPPNDPSTYTVAGVGLSPERTDRTDTQNRQG
jgi:hypothetical protein